LSTLHAIKTQEPTTSAKDEVHQLKTGEMCTYVFTVLLPFAYIPHTKYQ